MLSRRRVLATVGIAAASAGCAGLPERATDPVQNGSNGTDTGENSLADGEATLGSVTLQSTDDDDHSVQIAVEDSDGIVHLDSYQLTADTPRVTVSDAWEQTPSAYRVTVRSDSSDPRTITVADRLPSGSDCVSLLILLDTDGGFSVWNQGCSE